MIKKFLLAMTLIGMLLATVFLSFQAFHQQIVALNNGSQALEYFFLRDRNFANMHFPVWGNWTWNKSVEDEGLFEGYSRFFPSGGTDLYYNETGGKGWGGAVFLQGTHPHTGFRDFILGGENLQSAVLKEYVSFNRTDKIPENEFVLSAKVMVNERSYTTFGNRLTADSAVGVDLMFGFDDANYSASWDCTSAIHADVILSRVFWDNATKTLQYISNCSDNTPSPYDKDHHLTLIRGKMENLNTWYEFNIDLGEIIKTIFTLLPNINTIHFRGVQVYIDGISSYTKATFSYVYTTLISEKFTTVFQKGMSYTTYANLTPNAYGSVESDESLRRMRWIGVEWVAINVVGWYQTNSTSADIHMNPNQAPTNEALQHVIRTAHSLNMNVMLKPMVDLEDGRPRSEIQPSEEWFENYTSYINFFAELAEQQDVEMFCIGTELNGTVSWESEWRSIISGVRHRYSGFLTYAAIWWKEYDELKWWDAVDYVGIDAYFPLSNKSDPTIAEMKATWESIANYLDWFYLEVGKPILFTEIGYQSVDGANIEPWNWIKMFSSNLDLQEQADCYEASFQALWNRTWLCGMYWWYWQTNPDAGGSSDKDYTPQNKPAQGVLTHWYYVIPEFPSALILPLFMIATLLTVIVYKRKHFR